VRYVAVGPVINQRICHCRLCQKSLGAAFNARLLFRIADVSISGPLATFPSSAVLKRGFCPKCGTTLTSAREGVGVIGVSATSLDDPQAFQPEMHTWTSSRQPWVRLDDGLPQFEQGPPA
jgi:hypothetical protein